MEAKDLMFFNKEGYQMNLSFNESVNYHYGNIYFDKNSTDTFKTLGIYTFEKIAPTNYTFDAYLENYQLFNYNDIIARPARLQTPIAITDIKKSNNSASFYSKWIYATDVEKYLKPGDWFYFENIGAYYAGFTTTQGSDYRLFQVILSEPGRILVMGDGANNAIYPTYNTSYNGLIVPANVIEFNTENIIDIFIYSLRNYPGKKIQLISENALNNGILTTKQTTQVTQRHRKTLLDNLFVPNDGDRIEIDIELLTDRLQLSNGVTTFSPGSYTPIVGTDSIQVPYVPNLLKVGDVIMAEAKTTPLLGPNTVSLTVMYIDRTQNIIEVNAILNNQNVDCYVYFATNHFKINQEIIKDNNNLVSLPVTYWSIEQQYKDILKEYGISLYYDKATNSLDISESYSNFTSYFTLTANHLTSNGTLITSYPIAAVLDITVLPHFVESLTYEETISRDASKFSRKIVFNTIDDAGLNIIINGKLYDVDFNVDAVTTLADWYAQYDNELTGLGIVHTLSTTTLANDTLLLEPELENRPIEISLRMGDFSDYYVLDAVYTFVNIKNQLLININGVDYSVPFVTNDATTCASWLTTYTNFLKSKGIIVFGGMNDIIFAKRDANEFLNITYNIGYLPKSGDDSVLITKYATENNGSLISGNEIKTNSGTYNLLDYYSAGQKITLSSPAFNNLLINGRSYLNNQSYNILDVSDSTIWPSYQGSFWDQGDTGNLIPITINSDFFIHYPRTGISTSSNKSYFRWSWKDTQTEEIFLYDLSGSQLKPIYNGFPEYNGPLPLCGEDGTINVSLNKKPNDKIEFISDPTKQQTIFDYLDFELKFLDDEQSPNELVYPMQTFIGYNQKIESWVKSRLYLEHIEDITFSLDTQSDMMTNVWSFKGNTIEVLNPNITFDFAHLGFKAGQTIEITSLDITNNDGKKLVNLQNNGKKVKIKSVTHHKITLVNSNVLITETSVATIGKTTLPHYDSNGNALTENRWMQVTLTVQPTLLAYFTIYGESEAEDERHDINLNNKNLNVLQLKDFFIFKEVDINEEGVDWIILNRKRKELLEIYPQIFNNVSSYKSIIQAINFFGYNDLTFTEYFQNVNPDSKKFGQLFNMDLLYLFDKSVKGWSYSNQSIDNLKNRGYKKTNLFSLNYKVTDMDGNFIDAYSREEVQIKLNGLKRWLTENLIPLGAKITDINGKFNQPLDWHIKHETYKSHGLRVEEYSNPIDFDVDGYLQPISLGSNNFDITVHPKCAGPVEWYDYKVRTFNLTKWDTTYFYTPGTILMHNGKIWEATIYAAINEEPGVSNAWIPSSIDKLTCTQIFTDSRFDLSPWSFTVNELLDPHFVVEVNWHSGYSCTWQIRKAYSVIPNFFDNFNI